MGHDFSQVHVHTGEQAAESARAVSAKAYTAGNHVVFADGQYRPGSSSGRSLLAHELSHVAQQASGPVEGTPIGDGVSVSQPGDRFERAAQANSGVARPAARQGATANAPLGNQMVVQRFTDTSPDSNYAQQQANAGTASAGAAQSSASAAWLSAGVGLFSGLVSAYTGIRSANFAGRSAEAAEDPPTAEPTTGGLTVTDADIPEIKALDLKKVDDPDKDPDSVTKTTETGRETPNDEDITKTGGQSVETTSGEGDKAKKTTATSSKSATKRAGTTTTRESTSKVFKPEDKPDQLRTHKILHINQGENDWADFFLSIRSNNEDIKDGGTEPPVSSGYLGGSSESNASVNFKVRPGQHNANGSATARLLIGGTNTPPRKTLQSTRFFGSGGPTANEHYQVQRFNAVITFDARTDVPPVVGRVNPGIGTAAPRGTGAEDGSALVSISLPDTYLPPGKRKDKK
jgi:hypothetical protein